MRSTISEKLFKALQKGKGQLGAEALLRVARFVESQQTEESSFKDKSGKADIYYTSFGWILSYILDIGIEAKKMEAYLSQQESERLDLVHYAAYLRCQMVKQLMKGGKISLLLRSLFSTKIRALNTMEGIPHNDVQSPYTQFVMLSLLEDARRRIKEKEDMTDSLANYHLPNGGYRNTRDGLTATTNATAAALAVIGQLRAYKANEDVLYLRNMQQMSGGFAATMDSPLPDLLSTATALFTLSCYGVKPKYSARDFIEAHWLDSGGFSATLLEDKSDVEYTFYGLLALGVI